MLGIGEHNLAPSNKTRNTRTKANNSRTKKDLVKLERATNKLASRFATNLFVGKQRPARKVRASVRSADNMANVPLQVAYTKRQVTGPQTTRVRFSDQLANIVVTPTEPVGRLWQFPLNPLQMARTRLRQYAGLYGKFRFKAAKLCVGVNMPTTVNGNYTLGYAQNPDFEFGFGERATAQVYALKDAVNKPWWMKGESVMNITDKQKWYNIDADSDEVMMTTQGQFVLTNVSPPSITAPVTVPIFIDYDVEFSENAIQSNGNANPVLWPAGTFTPTVVTSSFTYTISPDETLAQPVLELNVPYTAYPPFGLNTSEGQKQLVGVMATTNNTNFSFYTTLDAYRNNVAFGPTGTDPSPVPRTNVTPN